MKNYLIPALLMCCIPSTVAAYIGPGLGLGAIGTVLGIFAAIILAIIGVVWYPLKRFLKKRKSEASQTSGHEE